MLSLVLINAVVWELLNKTFHIGYGHEPYIIAAAAAMIHSNVHIFSLHIMHSALSPQKYLKSALLALITTLRNSFVNDIQTRTLEENMPRPVVPELKSLLVSRDPTPPFGDLYEFELPR